MHTQRLRYYCCAADSEEPMSPSTTCDVQDTLSLDIQEYGLYPVRQNHFKEAPSYGAL